MSIECTSAPGVGAGLSVTVSVGRPAQNDSSLSVSYTPPTLTSSSLSTLSSDASTVVTFSGSNFGPSDEPLQMGLSHGVYGSCSFSYQSHSDGASGNARAIGQSCLGNIGTGYNITVTVGGQTVVAVPPSTLRFQEPTISAVTSVSSTFPTSGGTQFTLTGTQFGNSNSFIDSVVYGSYTATSCTIQQDSFSGSEGRIVCSTDEGIGRDHQVVLTIGTQSSTASSSITVSYDAPTINRVLPYVLSTNGSNKITVYGDNFGPLLSTPELQYGPAGSTNLYRATSCSVTSIASESTLLCDSVAGIGTSLSFNVSIGGQSGQYSNSSYSYRRPRVASFTPAGPFETSATTTLTISGSDFGPSSGNTVQLQTYETLCAEYDLADSAISFGQTLHTPSQIVMSTTGTPNDEYDGAFFARKYELDELIDVEVTVQYPSADACVRVAANVKTSWDLSNAICVTDTGSIRRELVEVDLGVAGFPRMVRSRASLASGKAFPVTLRAVESSKGNLAFSAKGNGEGSFTQYFTVSPTEVHSYPPYAGIYAKSPGSFVLDTSFCTGLNYTSSCTVTAADTTAECAQPAGIGSDLSLAVRWGTSEGLGSLQSRASLGLEQQMSKNSPTISGATITDADLSGGSTVTLAGTNFGPAGTTLDLEYKYDRTVLDPLGEFQDSASTLTATGSSCTYNSTEGMWAYRLGSAANRTEYAVKVVSGGSDASHCITARKSLADSSNRKQLCVGINSVSFLTSDSASQVTSQSHQLNMTYPLYLKLAIDPESPWLVSGYIKFAENDPWWQVDSQSAYNFASSSAEYLGILAFESSNTGGVPTQFKEIDTQRCASTVVKTVTCSSAGHASAQCTVPAGGVGRNLKFALTAGRQTSSDFQSTLSYAAPTISSISVSVFNTTGAPIVTVSGTNLGGSVVAKDCEIQVISSTATQNWTACLGSADAGAALGFAPAGFGTGLDWKLLAGNQWTNSLAGASSYLSPLISSVTAPAELMTEGGESVTLFGDNFDLFPTADDQATKQSRVNVTYGPAGDLKRYQCVPSDIQYSRIICTTSAGVGANLQFIVTLEGRDSSASQTTHSYGGPLLYSLTMDTSRPTAGGAKFNITGANFGSEIGKVWVRYGPPTSSWSPDLTQTTQAGCLNGRDGYKTQTTYAYSEFGLYFPGCDGATCCQRSMSPDLTRYNASSCSFLSTHTHLQCTMPEGVGSNFIEVIVDGQYSGFFNRTALTYAVPVFDAAVDTLAPISTTGGVVALTGSNFGPVGTNVTADLRQSDSSIYYTWLDCSVVVAHTQINCTVPAGVGAALVWRAIVGDQVGDPSGSGTRFQSPVITSVSQFDGGSTVKTYRGRILINGTNFGPSNETLGFYFRGAEVELTNPAAAWAVGGTYTSDRYSCDLITPHTALACTVSGVGTLLETVVIVAGQNGTMAGTRLNFTAPQITGIAPALVHVSAGELLTITGSNFAELYTDLSGQFGRNGLQISIGTSSCTFVGFSREPGSVNGNVTCYTQNLHASGSVGVSLSVGGQASSSYSITAYKLTSIASASTTLTVRGGETVTVNGASLQAGAGVAPIVRVTSDAQHCSGFNTTLTSVASAGSLGTTLVENRMACQDWPLPVYNATPSIAGDGLSLTFAFPSSDAFIAEATAAAAANGGAAPYALAVKLGRRWIGYQLVFRVVGLPTVTELSVKSGPSRGDTLTTITGSFFPTGALGVKFGNISAPAPTTTLNMTRYGNTETGNPGFRCSSGTYLGSRSAVNSISACEYECQRQPLCDVYTYDPTTSICDWTTTNYCTSTSTTGNANTVTSFKLSNYPELCPHPYISGSEWICGRLRHSYQFDDSEQSVVINDEVGANDALFNGSALDGYGFADFLGRADEAFIELPITESLDNAGSETGFTFEFWASLPENSVDEYVLDKVATSNGASSTDFSIRMSNSPTQTSITFQTSASATATTTFSPGLAAGPRHIVWVNNSYVYVDGSPHPLSGGTLDFALTTFDSSTYRLRLLDGFEAIYAFRFYGSELTPDYVQLLFARGRDWSPVGEHPVSNDGLYASTSCELRSMTTAVCESPAQKWEWVPTAGVPLGVNASVDTFALAHYGVESADFFYYRNVTLEAFTPNVGSPAGTTVVNVTGAHIVRTQPTYSGAPKCRWSNNNDLDGTFLGDGPGSTVIQCPQPAYSFADTTEVKLQVSLNGQQFTTTELNFTIFNVPNITRTVSPVHGPMVGNTTVTLTGDVFIQSDFILVKMTRSSTTQGEFETFVPARYLSSTEIAFETAALPTSVRGADFQTEPFFDVNITVALDGQTYTATEATYRYYYPASAKTMTPVIGYFKNPHTLNITGRFYNTSKVYVRLARGGSERIVECSYASQLSTSVELAEIQCNIPAWLDGLGTPTNGAFSVGVSNDLADDNGGNQYFEDTKYFVYYNDDFPVYSSTTKPAFTPFIANAELSTVLNVTQLVNSGADGLTYRSDFYIEVAPGNGTRPYFFMKSSTDKSDLHVSDVLRIEIDNTDAASEALVNYQVPLVVNISHLIQTGAISSYLYLNFYDEDAATPLYWWVEPAYSNASNAHIFVKVPSIPANTVKVIHMSAGGSAPSSYFDPTMVFEFYDEYGGGADGTRWVTGGTGEYVVAQYADGYRWFQGSARFERAPRANISIPLDAGGQFAVEVGWAPQEPAVETGPYVASDLLPNQTTIEYWNYPSFSSSFVYFSTDPNALFVSPDDDAVGMSSGTPFEGFALSSLGGLVHTSAGTSVDNSTTTLSQCKTHSSTRHATITKTASGFEFELHVCDYSGDFSVETASPLVKFYNATNRFNASLAGKTLYLFSGASPTPRQRVLFTDNTGVSFESSVRTGLPQGSFDMKSFFLVDASGRCFEKRSSDYAFTTCDGSNAAQTWTKNAFGLSTSGANFVFVQLGSSGSFLLNETTTGQCLTLHSGFGNYSLASCNSTHTLQLFTVNPDEWRYARGAQWIAVRKSAIRVPDVPVIDDAFLNAANLWKFDVATDGASILNPAAGNTRSLHLNFRSDVSTQFTGPVTTQTEYNATISAISSTAGLDSDAQYTYVLRNGWTGQGAGLNQVYVNGSGLVSSASAQLRIPFTNYYLYAPCAFETAERVACTIPSTPLLPTASRDAGLGTVAVTYAPNGVDYLAGVNLAYYAITFSTTPSTAPLRGGTLISVTARLSGLTYTQTLSLLQGRYENETRLHFGNVSVPMNTSSFTITQESGTVVICSMSFKAPAFRTGDNQTQLLRLTLVGNQTLDSNGNTDAERYALRGTAEYAHTSENTNTESYFYYYDDNNTTWTHSPHGGNERPSSASPGTTVRWRGEGLSTLMSPTVFFNKTSGTEQGSTCDSVGTSVGGSTATMSRQLNNDQPYYVGNRTMLLDPTVSYLEYQAMYTPDMFDEAFLTARVGESLVNFTTLTIGVHKYSTRSMYNVEIAYADVNATEYVSSFTTAISDSAFTTVYGPASIPQADLTGSVTLTLDTPIAHNVNSSMVLRLRRRFAPLLQAIDSGNHLDINSSFAHRVIPIPRSLVQNAERTVAGVTTLDASVGANHPSRTVLDITLGNSDEVEISAFVLGVADGKCSVGGYSMELFPNGIDAAGKTDWTVYNAYIVIRELSPDIAVKSGGISMTFSALDSELASGAVADRDLIRIRWKLVTTEYANSYLVTPGTVSGNDIIAETPDLTGLNISGFITATIDVTLNGEVYTVDYSPNTLKNFYFHDTPQLLNFTPAETIMLGGTVNITASNIFYRRNYVRCSFGTSIETARWNSSLDNTQCNDNCFLQCTAPPSPHGNVTLGVTINQVTYYYSPDDFVYKNCDPGYITPDYRSACSACDAGYRSEEPERTQCIACGLTEYQPQNTSTTCLSCPTSSLSTYSAATSLRQCLCIANYYKIDYPDAVTPCRPCPQNAQCVGGWVMPKPDSGYYRDPEIFDLIKLCYPQESCLGGTNSSCETGYDGYLCGKCASGYYHNGNRCYECAGIPWYGNISFLLQVLLTYGLITFIFVNLKLMSKVASIGVLANFFQLAFMISMFRLNWPKSYRVAFEFLSWPLPVLFYPNWLESSQLECDYGDMAGYSFPVAYCGQLMTVWAQLFYVFILYSLTKVYKACRVCKYGREAVEKHNFGGRAKEIETETAQKFLDGLTIGQAEKLPVGNDHDNIREYLALRKLLRYQHAQKLVNTINLILTLNATYLWRAFFSLWACQDQPDGVKSQLVRMHLKCFEYDEWGADYHSAIVAVMIGSLIAMVTPIVLLLVTEPKGTYQKWWSGSFYKRYRQGYRRYFLVYIFRSAVFAVTTLYVENGVFQAFIAMVVLVSCLLLDITGAPHKDDENDLLEQISLGTLLVLTFVGMTFSMEMSDLQSVKIWQILLQTLALILLCVTALRGVYVFIREVLKRISFAAIKKNQRKIEEAWLIKNMKQDEVADLVKMAGQDGAAVDYERDEKRDYAGLKSETKSSYYERKDNASARAGEGIEMTDMQKGGPPDGAPPKYARGRTPKTSPREAERDQELTDLNEEVGHGDYPEGIPVRHRRGFEWTGEEDINDGEDQSEPILTQGAGTESQRRVSPAWAKLSSDNEKKIRSELQARFVHKVVKTTLAASSEIVPQNEIPSLLANHSTFSAKLEEGRVKVYKFWMEITLKEKLQTLLEQARDHLAVFRNQKETVVRGAGGGRAFAKKPARPKLETRRMQNMRERAHESLVRAIDDTFEFVDQQVQELLEWFKRYNQSMFSMGRVCCVNFMQKPPTQEDLEKLSQLKAYLGDTIFKIHLIASPDLAAGADSSQGLDQRSPFEKLQDASLRERAALKKVLSKVDWDTLRKVSGREVSSVQRKSLSVDRKIADSIKYSDQRRGRRSSITLTDSDERNAVTARMRHVRGGSVIQGTALSMSSNGIVRGSVLQGSQLADRRLREVSEILGRHITEVSEEEEILFMELKNTPFSGIPPRSEERSQLMANLESELSDALGVSLDNVRVLRLLQRDEERTSALISIFFPKKVDEADLGEILESSASSNSADHKIGRIVEDGKLDDSDDEDDELALGSSETTESGSGVGKKRVATKKQQKEKKSFFFIERRVQQNRDRLLRARKLRESCSAITDFLLDMLMTMNFQGDAVRRRDHTKQFIRYLGVIDPADYITDELLLDYANSYETRAAEWIALQKGVAKIVEDFKFNIVVRKSGVEGLVVQPANNEGMVLAQTRSIKFYQHERMEELGFFAKLCACLGCYDTSGRNFNVEDREKQMAEEDEAKKLLYYQAFKGDRVQYKVVFRNRYRNIKLPSSRTIIDVSLEAQNWRKKLYHIKDPVPQVRLAQPASVSFLIPREVPAGLYRVLVKINGVEMNKVEDLRGDESLKIWKPMIADWEIYQPSDKAEGVFRLKVDEPLDGLNWNEIGGELSFKENWIEGDVTRKTYELDIFAPAQGGLYEFFLKVKRTNSDGAANELETVEYMCVTDIKEGDKTFMYGSLAPRDEKKKDLYKYSVRLRFDHIEAGEYTLGIQVDGMALHAKTLEGGEFKGERGFQITLGQPDLKSFEWIVPDAKANEEKKALEKAIMVQRGMNDDRDSKELSLSVEFKVCEKPDDLKGDAKEVPINERRLASMSYLTAIVRTPTGLLDTAIIAKKSDLDPKRKKKIKRKAETADNDWFSARFQPQEVGKYTVFVFLHHPVRVGDDQTNLQAKLEAGRKQWEKQLRKDVGRKRKLSDYWQRNPETGKFIQKQTYEENIHMPVRIKRMDGIMVGQKILDQIENARRKLDVVMTTDFEGDQQDRGGLVGLLQGIGVLGEEGHTAKIRCQLVVDGGTGKVLYTGSSNELCVWDLQSGRLLQRFGRGAYCLALHLEHRDKKVVADGKAAADAKVPVVESKAPDEKRAAGDKRPPGKVGDAAKEGESDGGSVLCCFGRKKKKDTDDEGKNVVRYILAGGEKGTLMRYKQNNQRLEAPSGFQLHNKTSTIQGVRVTHEPEARIWTWATDFRLKYSVFIKDNGMPEPKDLEVTCTKFEKENRLIQYIEEIRKFAKSKAEGEAIKMEEFKGLFHMRRKVRKAGFLEKRGGEQGNKGWKRRHFRLTASTQKGLILTYHEKLTSKAKGEIKLHRAQIAQDPEEERQFTIQTMEGKTLIGRKFFLQARTAKEATQWINAIYDNEFKPDPDAPEDIGEDQIDFEALQVCLINASRRKERKSLTNRFEKVVKTFFDTKLNGFEALKEHFRAKKIYKKHQSAVNKLFPLTFPGDYVRLTGKQLRERLATEPQLLEKVNEDLKDMKEKIAREQKKQTLITTVQEDGDDEAESERRVLRPRLMVDIRSAIVKVDLVPGNSSLAYVLASNNRVHYIDLNRQRMIRSREILLGNQGNPYGLAPAEELNGKPKYIFALSQKRLRIEKVEGHMDEREKIFIKGNTKEQKALTIPSIVGEGISGQAMLRVDYEDYDPNVKNESGDRYDVERKKYKRRTLIWIGTKALADTGARVYAIDMSRLGLNNWSSLADWQGYPDQKSRQADIEFASEYGRNCPLPIGTRVENGKLQYNFKNSRTLKNKTVTCVFSPGSTHTLKDFEEMGLQMYYESLVQNSIFLGFDDGTIEWFEYLPDTESKKWGWKSYPFGEAHNGEIGEDNSVRSMDFVLEKDFRPFLITYAKEQPIKWNIANSEGIAVSKDLRPAPFTTRAVAWATFLVENFQMLSFGFASDFFWPPSDSTDWFMEFGNAINFQFTLGTIEYLVLAASFSSFAMLLFVFGYTFYNTNEKNQAKAHAINRKKTPWLFYLHNFCEFWTWGCTLGIMPLIKGVTFIFNCSIQDDGKYYHRMVGNGKNMICYDSSDTQFYLMFLALPAPFFLIYGLRLRRLEGEMVGIAPNRLTRWSLSPSAWGDDFRPATQFHRLVPHPSEWSKLYPLAFAIVRIVYGVMQVLLIDRPYVKAATLMMGSFVLLVLALYYPVYASTYANSLNMTSIVTFLWTNVMAFINITAAEDGGDGEKQSSQGDTVIEAQSNQIAGIVILYLLGLFFIFRGFPGFQYRCIKKWIPSVWDLATDYYEWREKIRRKQLREEDLRKRSAAFRADEERLRQELAKHKDVADDIDGDDDKKIAGDRSSVSALDGPKAGQSAAASLAAVPESKETKAAPDPEVGEEEAEAKDEEPANDEGEPANDEGEPANDEGEPANDEGEPANDEEPENKDDEALIGGDGVE